MPKGVEHCSDIWCDHLLRECWISDAERRWARERETRWWRWDWGVESLMPKGVEHWLAVIASADVFRCWISDAERRWAQISTVIDSFNTSVLNLWCRKALSTVERVQRRSLSWSVESLMPKGVEHRKAKKWWWFLKGVESLMPKGVEHHLSKILLMPLDFKYWISDAERRWAQ